MRKLFCFSAAFAAAVFALRYGAAPLALLALPAAQAALALEILSAAGETAYQIGEVISGEDGVVLV